MIRKHLLLSTALPLFLFAGGVQSFALPPLQAKAPQHSMVLNVQMSVEDAETRLRLAQIALDEATANGGDVAAAQAELSNAQAEVDAAKAAQQPAEEPAPEPTPEPAPAVEPTPEPAPAVELRLIIEK